MAEIIWGKKIWLSLICNLWGFKKIFFLEAKRYLQFCYYNVGYKEETVRCDAQFVWAGHPVRGQ